MNEQLKIGDYFPLSSGAREHVQIQVQLLQSLSELVCFQHCAVKSK